MKKKKLMFQGILILIYSCLSLQASTQVELKLRVYEGARHGALASHEFITSSYIQSTITANILTASELKAEKEQIKRVFNLQDVSLLTEADLMIGVERAAIPADSVRHFFRLNGKAFMTYLRLLEVKPDFRFLVLFNEMIGEKPKNVLTTSMILHGGHTAIFGFEDRQGKPYFCAFHVTGPPELLKPPPPPPPPAPPEPPELKKKRAELEKGAIKAWNTINPPRLLKKVDPVYPDAAKEKGLEGYVSLAVRTDGKGNVKQILIIKSSDKIFNHAAIEAVKQWKYEPYVEDGQPKELVFTVSVKFKL